MKIHYIISVYKSIGIEHYKYCYKNLRKVAKSPPEKSLSNPAACHINLKTIEMAPKSLNLILELTISVKMLIDVDHLGQHHENPRN